MRKQLISTLLLGAMVLTAHTALASEDHMMKKHDTMMVHELNIVDVTGGKQMRGIVTSPQAAGHASAYYEDGTYYIHGTFSSLTTPEGDDFYEGWVVRKNPFAFISTGMLEKIDGIYVNDFSADTDYSDYNFYVVTLEPNDGDDAPAIHILEGDLSAAMMMKGEDTMMENTMMKKELTETQKALRAGIKVKLQNVDFAKIDLNIVLEKIKTIRNSIDEKSYSAEKKARYLELLDAIEDVLIESSMMHASMMKEADTMMKK